MLNHYFARRYNGKLIVRFDDTNPDKEKNDFVDGIMEDIKTLGLDPDVVTYTPDSFDAILETGEKLIEEGKMYVDTADVDTMRSERMQKIESKCRNQSVDENMRLWKEMKKGSKEGGRVRRALQNRHVQQQWMHARSRRVPMQRGHAAPPHGHQVQDVPDVRLRVSVR